MSNLFDLNQQFYTLRDILENDVEFNEETGEIIDNSETINKLFEELELSLNDKLDNCQKWILENSAKVEALKKESKRLESKYKAIENKTDRLKELMKLSLVASGKTIKTDIFTFSLRKSKAVQVADENELPRNYVRIEKKPDKKAIKEALENGIEIPGCSFAENVSLSVK